MASAKQIAWRKKFAKKYGKKKTNSSTKKGETRKTVSARKAYETKSGGNLLYGKTPEYHRKKLRELGYTERTINKFLRSHGKL